MLKPLLGGESSSSDQQFGQKVFRRRSDAITYGSRYQKAAALVDLAEDGIGLPVEVLHSRFESGAKFYFIYIKFDFLWFLNLFALIVLNFFEGITLLILAIHTLFPVAYEGYHLYWKNHLNKLKVISVLVLIADLVIYSLYLSPVPLNSLPLRIAPYVRVIFFILNFRELRACIVTLAGMAGTYLNVLALWLLFLLFSSWLAYVIFEDTLQGKTVFTSYGTTLYQMFVLFTTSNNPDVWIPAYKVSRWYCLFFVLYVLLGVYFITNLILAVVYDSFKSQLAKQVAEMDLMRKRNLGEAFNLIDEHGLGFINKEQCIHLFEELNKYRTLPKISREDFESIFHELDDSHDFKVLC
ncbi:PREDICTED: two pore calcium channel protein 1A isoform X2 [Nelumbo nucifera]|uniref:Two pore calcium channel protein 1A isoform X2 n=1 Tax=Nelumbo nucifera TaxID=4432 RepID=A0A1U8PY92_NELNU|nr:PREDICTED: two pore calcium channel protein 1A isoform X2 [Nelumbo nucifera]